MNVKLFVVICALNELNTTPRSGFKPSYKNVVVQLQNLRVDTCIQNILMTA